MKVRNQVLDRGTVVLDTMLEARNPYLALRKLVEFHGVRCDPARFRKVGNDWVVFHDGSMVYRVMSERKFG